MAISESSPIPKGSPAWPAENTPRKSVAAEAEEAKQKPGRERHVRLFAMLSRVDDGNQVGANVIIVSTKYGQSLQVTGEMRC